MADSLEVICSSIDLLGWSPPRLPGREARLWRFAALRDLYVAVFGSLPLIVKVTGSAGKGSVAAMLEAALLADGQAVGLFTSPHLISITERIRINGVDVTQHDLDRVALQTQAFFQRFMQLHGREARPSFFEALLILALRLFDLAECHRVIAEVAIGGYNDIVSLLPSPLAVITTVGQDHAEELGPTLIDVARDKAGIATVGSTLVLGPAIDAKAVAAIATDARARQVQLIDAGELEVQGVSTAAGHDLRVSLGCEAIDVQLPLRGKFQIDNFKTVATTLRVLQELGAVRSIGCIAGVAHTRWPARLECFAGSPAWIIDSAHNSLAFQALAEYLGPRPTTGSRVLLLGASELDKAASAVAILAPLFTACYLVEGFFKSVSLESLAPAVTAHCGVEPKLFTAPAAAMHWLAAPERCVTQVVVTGSLYLAGACRERLVARPQSLEER
jgi:dihydrofolate synthase/folylpolyglutamate synthase